MSFRLIGFLLLLCSSCCWAEPATLLDRNQLLINICQDEGVEEFSRLLERPDMATLDSKAVSSAELHAWLRQYLDSRTLTHGNHDDSSDESGVFLTELSFQEQNEKLWLLWVQLKGGEFYLRGVEVPQMVGDSQPEVLNTQGQTQPTIDDYSNELLLNEITNIAQDVLWSLGRNGRGNGAIRGLDGFRILRNIFR